MKLITLLIIIASFGCNNQKPVDDELYHFDLPMDEPSSYSGIIKGINTSEFNIGDTLFINGIIDSTAWIPIDTVYGDTVLTIDNSNYYRWYKIEHVGIGGPMVIHGTWINHKDSTITEFTITDKQ